MKKTKVKCKNLNICLEKLPINVPNHKECCEVDVFAKENVLLEDSMVVDSLLNDSISKKKVSFSNCSSILYYNEDQATADLSELNCETVDHSFDSLKECKNFANTSKISDSELVVESNHCSNSDVEVQHPEVILDDEGCPILRNLVVILERLPLSVLKESEKKNCVLGERSERIKIPIVSQNVNECSNSDESQNIIADNIMDISRAVDVQEHDEYDVCLSKSLSTNSSLKENIYSFQEVKVSLQRLPDNLLELHRSNLSTQNSTEITHLEFSNSVNNEVSLKDRVKNKKSDSPKMSVRNTLQALYKSSETAEEQILPVIPDHLQYIDSTEKSVEGLSLSQKSKKSVHKKLRKRDIKKLRNFNKNACRNSVKELTYDLNELLTKKRKTRNLNCIDISVNNDPCGQLERQGLEVPEMPGSSVHNMSEENVQHIRESYDPLSLINTDSLSKLPTDLNRILTTTEEKILNKCSLRQENSVKVTLIDPRELLTEKDKSSSQNVSIKKALVQLERLNLAIPEMDAEYATDFLEENLPHENMYPLRKDDISDGPMIKIDGRCSPNLATDLSTILTTPHKKLQLKSSLPEENLSFMTEGNLSDNFHLSHKEKSCFETEHSSSEDEFPLSQLVKNNRDPPTLSAISNRKLLNLPYLSIENPSCMAEDNTSEDDLPLIYFAELNNVDKLTLSKKVQNKSYLHKDNKNAMPVNSFVNFRLSHLTEMNRPDLPTLLINENKKFKKSSVSKRNKKLKKSSVSKRNKKLKKSSASKRNKKSESEKGNSNEEIFLSSHLENMDYIDPPTLLANFTKVQDKLNVNKEFKKSPGSERNKKSETKKDNSNEGIFLSYLANIDYIDPPTLLANFTKKVQDKPCLPQQNLSYVHENNLLPTLVEIASNNSFYPSNGNQSKRNINSVAVEDEEVNSDIPVSNVKNITMDHSYYLPLRPQTNVNGTSPPKKIRTDHSYHLPYSLYNVVDPNKVLASHNRKNPKIQNHMRTVIPQLSIPAEKTNKKKNRHLKGNRRKKLDDPEMFLKNYLKRFCSGFDKLAKAKSKKNSGALSSSAPKKKQVNIETMREKKENAYKIIIDNMRKHIKDTCSVKKSYKKKKSERNLVKMHEKSILPLPVIKVESEDNCSNTNTKQAFSVDSSNKEVNDESRYLSVKSSQHAQSEVQIYNKGLQIVKDTRVQENHVVKYRHGSMTADRSLRLFNKCLASERLLLSKYKMSKAQRKKLKTLFKSLKSNALNMDKL